MNYLVGDVQGCDRALGRLLAVIDFSPSRDRLVLVGDLVNRGPASLVVLQRLSSFGDAATCLLGNHDLHLLAVAHGVRGMHRGDTFDDVLASPQRGAWLDWLRRQRLAHLECGWLCVHAGVVPQWDAARTLALAAEVEALLRGPDLADFLPAMYGNEPGLWQDTLAGNDRWRLIINVLTRIRFTDVQGTLELRTKDSAGAAPAGFMPWFEVPGRRTADVPVAFGHWSTLGLMLRDDAVCLDTGCVWGGALTALAWPSRRLRQVRCPPHRHPGLPPT